MLAIGVFVGAAASSGLRTMIYVLGDRQPDMGPQLFILFSPILGAPIAGIALALHLAARKWFAYDRYWKWFAAGCGWGAILLVLVTPWLGLTAALLVNPAFLRVASGGMRRGDPS